MLLLLLSASFLKKHEWAQFAWNRKWGYNSFMIQIIFAMQSTTARPDLLCQIILHKIFVCKNVLLQTYTFRKKTSKCVSLACGSPHRRLSIFVSSPPYHFDGNIICHIHRGGSDFQKASGTCTFPVLHIYNEKSFQQRSDGADQAFFCDDWGQKRIWNLFYFVY